LELAALRRALARARF
jgi:endonuclease VIII